MARFLIALQNYIPPSSPPPAVAAVASLQSAGQREIGEAIHPDSTINLNPNQIISLLGRAG